MKLMNLRRRITDWRADRLNIKGDDSRKIGAVRQAETFFRAAIRLNGNHALAYSNLGSLLMELHRYDEGFALICKAAELRTDHAGILVNLGNAYMMGGRTADAVGAYRQAVQANRNDSVAAASLLRPLMDICDWDSLDQLYLDIKERVSSGLETDPSQLIAPFNSLFLPMTRREQLDIARQAARRFSIAQDGASFANSHPARRASGRIRIAYLSSDFHDHATAHLTLGLYGRHDRSRFEVSAYSIGYPDASAYRTRISRDCDHFYDVADLDAKQIAQHIFAHEIDILIDLKGYTGFGRPEILALRPAPIQVNYLGYPGTMGADFIDYLIADPVIIPEAHAQDYSETVMRLPDSYQPTDDQQAVAQNALDRASAGLPEGAFVFCSFNAPAKFDRRTFSCWMRILAAVPGSVLWLMQPSDLARRNLSHAAATAGVDPSRIVYAPPLAKDKHLARLRWADLVLDTFVCNAHTTGTDALWAGVPMVTLTGETFASRVATSLLYAVGLNNLATRSEEEYMATAVALARQPHEIARLKSSLSRATEKPLFQTDRYVHHLDAVYEEIFQRHTRLVADGQVPGR